MENVTIRVVVNSDEAHPIQGRILDAIPWMTSITSFVHPMFLGVPNGTVFEITLKPSAQGSCRIVSSVQLSDGCVPAENFSPAPRYYIVAWNEDDFAPLFDDLLGPYNTLDETKRQAQNDFARIMVIGPSGKFETVVEGEYDPDEDTMVWDD